MELISKPEWQSPSLVPLTGVRNSADGKAPGPVEDTYPIGTFTTITVAPNIS